MYHQLPLYISRSRTFYSKLYLDHTQDSYLYPHDEKRDTCRRFLSSSVVVPWVGHLRTGRRDTPFLEKTTAGVQPYHSHPEREAQGSPSPPAKTSTSRCSGLALPRSAPFGESARPGPLASPLSAAYAVLSSFTMATTDEPIPPCSDLHRPFFFVGLA